MVDSVARTQFFSSHKLGSLSVGKRIFISRGSRCGKWGPPSLHGHPETPPRLRSTVVCHATAQNTGRSFRPSAQHTATLSDFLSPVFEIHCRRTSHLFHRVSAQAGLSKPTNRVCRTAGSVDEDDDPSSAAGQTTVDGTHSAISWARGRGTFKRSHATHTPCVNTAPRSCSSVLTPPLRSCSYLSKGLVWLGFFYFLY